MCELASFVVTREKAYWSKVTNSHTEIIAEHNLHVDGVRGANAVNVELSPVDEDYSTDPKTWKFKTDQDDIPKWYTSKLGLSLVMLEIEEWRKFHICNQGAGRHNENLVGGDRVSQRSGDGATQKAGDVATQTAGDGATQKAGYGATQTAGYEATQTAGDRATQTAGYGATQKAGNWATQTAGYGATQTAGYEATQTAGNWATQTAGYGATQTAGNRATQTAGEVATQKAGLRTVQICRWWDGISWQVATRTIGEAEANKWYRFELGNWRECTTEEVGKAEKLGK